jgi:hypothetical protein
MGEQHLLDLGGVDVLAAARMIMSFSLPVTVR